MSSADPLFLLAALVGIAASVYWSKTGMTRKVAEGFIGGFGSIAAPITAMPPLWFVIDDYGTNSRKWADFGSRNSRSTNIGFINITKTRCAITQGGYFEVTELLGRAAVAEIIYARGGYVPKDHLAVPPKIWRAWARAALLSVAGGLYLDGLSLCVGPSFQTVISGKDAAVFGIDHDEKQNSGVGGPYAGWAQVPQNRGWVLMATAVAQLIDSGAQSWSAAIARNQLASWHNKHLSPHMQTIGSVEWSRRPDGRVIEIEDILGRSPSAEWSPPNGTVYVPLDLENLERSVTYKWFMRMSSEQIMEPDSHFIWAGLAKGAGSRDNLFTW
jgi:hypothetical protein